MYTRSLHWVLRLKYGVGLHSIMLTRCMFNYFDSISASSITCTIKVQRTFNYVDSIYASSITIKVKSLYITITEKWIISYYWCLVIDLKHWLLIMLIINVIRPTLHWLCMRNCTCNFNHVKAVYQPKRCTTHNYSKCLLAPRKWQGNLINRIQCWTKS